MKKRMRWNSTFQYFPPRNQQLQPETVKFGVLRILRASTVKPRRKDGLSLRVMDSPKPRTSDTFKQLVQSYLIIVVTIQSINSDHRNNAEAGEWELASGWFWGGVQRTTIPPPFLRRPHGNFPAAGVLAPGPACPVQARPPHPSPKAQPHQVLNRHDNTLSSWDPIPIFHPSSLNPTPKGSPSSSGHSSRAAAARTPPDRTWSCVLLAPARAGLARLRTSPAARARTHPWSWSQSRSEGFKSPCHAGGESGDSPVNRIIRIPPKGGKYLCNKHLSRVNCLLDDRWRKEEKNALPAFQGLTICLDWRSICKQIIVDRIYCVTSESQRRSWRTMKAAPYS